MAKKGKWVNVDELTPAGRALTNFEPGTIVKIKGYNFEIQRVQLDPPVLTLSPVSRHAAEGRE